MIGASGVQRNQEDVLPRAAGRHFGTCGAIDHAAGDEQRGGDCECENDAPPERARRAGVLAAAAGGGTTRGR